MTRAVSCRPFLHMSAFLLLFSLLCGIELLHIVYKIIRTAVNTSFNRRIVCNLYISLRITFQYQPEIFRKSHAPAFVCIENAVFYFLIGEASASYLCLHHCKILLFSERLFSIIIPHFFAGSQGGVNG